ncbi:MAG: aminotransferase class V-fold PLP-dependent enzyme [Eubacterium sp.]|nr:aminotransferase class V-fold PLP-dependent enzyme [Eubacterium sp.]
MIDRREQDVIYLDNAATTRTKPGEVIEAVVSAMQSLGNAGRGANDASLMASRSVYEVRSLLAEFFHGEDPARIAFTQNSTASLNMAIKGSLHPGDHVISTVLEHNSVLRPLYEMEARGLELTLLPCDEYGMVYAADFKEAIRDNTRAIICTHASNLTGNVLDIRSIGEIAARHDLLFIVDASQTAGVFDIDVEEMHIDILCFTGHKSLMGPQGTGGIYVKKGVKVRPLLTGGSGIKTFHKEHPEDMPAALEAGTLNGHGIAGLGAAIRYINMTGMDLIRRQEQDMAWYFYENIRDIPGVRVYGDFRSKNRCPIVTFNIGDCDSGVIGDDLLMNYDISVRTGGHCAPLMHQALGTASQGAVRVSFSHFNSTEEADVIIRAVREMAVSSC